MTQFKCNYIHFTTSGNTATVGTAGASSELVAVNVNTGGASAVLTIVDVTSTVTVAIINCAALASLQYRNIRIQGGLKATLSGGNADVTISYI